MSSARKGLRRAGVGSLSALLAATAMTGLASTASATTDATFTRVAGADRYATSAAVAKMFSAPTDLILASGEPGHTVDALAASYLAGLKGAPILLTHLNTTPQSVMDQIKASGAKSIFIVGGTGAISAAQEQALKDAGYTVNRLSGADRFGTAADIINHGNKSATALVATGLTFPDALGGGALAYAAGLPMALVRTDSVPADTLAALKNAGVTQVIILGGEGAVSAKVVAQLAAEGITVKDRIGGANRAATSAMLADYEIKNYGFTNTQANIASGYAFGDGADALGGAAFSGSKKTPLLITKNATQADELAAWLQANAKTVAGGYVFGGPGAVADALVAQLQAAARNVGSNQSYVVSPTGDQQATTSTDSTTNEGAVTLTFSGVTGKVKVALLPSDNVTLAANGSATFTDSDGTANVADGLNSTDEGNAVIESVNGAAWTASSEYSPVNGTVTVVVDSTSFDAGRVLVWSDADAGTDLDLKADNTPSEDFGVSGVVRWLPAEAASGTYTWGTVQYVDKDANLFVLQNKTFKYDSNDVAYYNGYRITMDQFETALSVGDSAEFWNGDYTRDPSLPNEWEIYFDTTGAPTSVAASVGDFDSNAADTGANDVKVTWSAPSPVNALIDHYEVYPTDAAGVITGAAVGQTDDASTMSVVVADQAVGDHYFAVRAVTKTFDDGDLSAPVKATVKAAPAPTTHDGAPLSSSAVYQDQNSNGILDSGDVLRVTFDELMSPPAAAASITLQDTDAAPTVAKVTAGTNSTWTLAADGKTYVITLTAAPVVTTAGTVGTVAFGASVTASSGVTDTAASNTPAGALDWDLAGSTDVTF